MRLLRQLLKNHDFLACCLLIFLSLVFFWKYFFKGLVPIPADIIVGIYYPWRDHIWNNLVAGVPIKNGLLSDVISIIYPWRIYGIELLKKGIWPLWIPHALAGAPLLTNFQSSLFYPVNILFFIFSDTRAWSVYIILQPVLASAFCFLYLRNLKLSFWPSLFGSFIFAFSGFSLVWLEYGIVGHAGLWLPLILLAIDKILNKLSFSWMVVGALAIGFSILAGYPQISFFAFLIALFYALYKVRFLKKKKGIFYVFLFFLLGIGLSSVQLLPGFEAWQLSIRGTDPTAAAFDFGLNPVKNLILAVAPDFYGNPSTGNFWGWGAYNESASYVGIVGLFLATIGFFARRKEKVLNFFKVVLIASLLLVFKNPISAFIFEARLPFLASSSAGRFLFLTSFSLAILASFGVDYLMFEKRTKKLPFYLGFLVIPFFLLLFTIFVAPSFWSDKNLIANLVVARRNLILPTGLVLASLALLSSFYLTPLSKYRKLALFLLFLLLVFDLFRFGFKYNSFSPKEYLYPETHLTNFLKDQKGLYRFTGLIPQSMFIPYSLSSPEGYDPLMTSRYNQFANQINEETFSQVKSGSRWVIVNRYDSPLLSVLGTKYLLSFKPDPKSGWEPEYYKYPEKEYKLIFQYGSSQVYERKDALPRAFIVHDFKVLKDEDILATLMAEDFKPEEILLLEEEPDRKPEEKLGEEAVINEGTYFDNQVLIKTNLLSDGFLFLSDNFYPGWRAYVDGEKTKIYRANYNFRAVFVPEGEHTVKFLFQPSSFKIGITISILALLVVIGLTGCEIIKSRYPSPEYSP